MYDRDAVIRHAAECARNHAMPVHNALADYITLGAPAVGALRAALVAQSVGFEGSSHDGSTYDARVAAAKAAIEAWDGPAGRGVNIRLGDIGIRCDKHLAQIAGWSLSQDAAGHCYARPESDGAERDLTTAVTEGLTDDAAMRRAIVLRTQRLDRYETDSAARKLAAEATKTAGMRLAAEREVTKRAAKG